MKKDINNKKIPVVAPVVNYNLGLNFIPNFNENFIFNSNYMRSKMNNINSNFKKINLGFKYKIIKNKLIYMLGFDFLKGDIEEYFFSFDISKELNNKYVIKIGAKFDLKNQSIVSIPFISLFYSL